MIRPLRERNPFWLGVITVAALATAVLVALAAGALGLGQTRYTGEFAHTGGLRPGDDVRIAGMSVGEVTGTELAGDRVLVSFRVSDDVSLGANTAATIKLATLLGERYLELRPSGGGELPERRIPLAHTSVPYDLQKVLETGTPLFEELDAEQLRKALDAVASTLRQDGPKVEAALDGMTRLSEVVNTRRDQIAALITNTQAVTAMLNQRSDQIFTLLGQSDALLAELALRRELIRGVLADLDSFTQQLRALLAENQSRVGPLLADAEKLTELLRRNDDAVDRALELLAPASRYLNNSLGNGPYWDVYLPYSILPDNVLCRAGAVSGCR